MNKAFFSKPTTVNKGRELISYDVDWDFAPTLAESKRTSLKYTHTSFPILRMSVEDEYGYLHLKRADAVVLEMFGVALNKHDIVTNIDGDFSNLTFQNLVVIRHGTDAYIKVKDWLKANPFDKNPYEGVFWHLWSGKWTAYNDAKVLLGLYSSPALALNAIERWSLWWNSSVT